MRNTMEAKNSGRGEPVESMCWSQIRESDQLPRPSDGDHTLHPVGRQSGTHLDSGLAVNSVPQ